MHSLTDDTQVLLEQHPTDSFAKAVIEGLSRPRKSISPKFLYDQRGSELFDRLRDCPEYYIPATEIGILERHAREISDAVGPRALLIEFGSGASLKTRVLLDHLRDLAAYVPIDISRSFLLESAKALEKDYPRLNLLPVCADFTEPLELPRIGLPDDLGRRLAFFPGSTIGNFDRPDALEFLRATAQLLGKGGSLLIGVDLIKDRAVLEPAYNDSRGVTAAFNLNLLVRMRDELGAGVDPSAFRHLAFYNEKERRIEMHLESLREQEFEVLGHRIQFRKGETIHTESSHKYLPSHFEEMAHQAGFRLGRFWTDSRRYFAVFLLET